MRSALRLETLKGPVRSVLRPLPRVDAARPAPDPIRLLSDSLRGRWRRFRKRFRAARDARRPQELDEAVHDLRTSARRLMSTIEAIGAFGARRRARTLHQRVNDILRSCGDLRDLAVLKSLAADVARLPSFQERLDRAYRRESKKLRKRLDLDELRAVRRGARALRERLRGADAGDALERARGALRASFENVREARSALDPTDVASVHTLRVALKGFRYLTEELRPTLPGAEEEDVETLHKLQTTMGDLHDLEVLSSELAKRGEGARVVADLEERHHRLLRSLLRAIDPVLSVWTRALDGG
jgi:CHAD domain-containing protein